VLGSLNMDLVVQCPRLPKPGETLLGTAFATVPGGKGANQAVAAARLGAVTRMVGCVGDDAFGQTLCQGLTTEGIAIDSVRTLPQMSTGIAAIAVAATGENHIVVVPGANGSVGSPDLETLQRHLASAESLLMQLEIPLGVVVAAAHFARAAGVRVILDPAPVQSPLPKELYPLVNILTPNQGEAAQMVGFPVETLENAAEAAKVLRQQGVETVLVKLGAQGVVGATAAETFHIPAFSVRAIDTVAAGDAFNGGLAVALQEGRSLRQAVAWASGVAALSVTQSGAQPSLPGRSQVDAFLAANPPRY
jgi:ribokinase